MRVLNVWFGFGLILIISVDLGNRYCFIFDGLRLKERVLSFGLKDLRLFLNGLELDSNLIDFLVILSFFVEMDLSFGG